jgi:hypothetical protein
MVFMFGKEELDGWHLILLCTSNKKKQRIFDIFLLLNTITISLLKSFSEQHPLINRTLSGLQDPAMSPC